MVCALSFCVLVILRYEQVTIKMEVKKQNEYVYIRVR